LRFLNLEFRIFNPNPSQTLSPTGADGRVAYGHLGAGTKSVGMRRSRLIISSTKAA
jgi:hypothetical protein